MKFNEVHSKNDLATILNIKVKTLTFVLYKKQPSSFYNSFEIPKKNGSPRIIHAPFGALKNIQKKLAQALWKHQQLCWREKHISPNVSHAFEKNKSIITNAIIHKNKRIIIAFDIKDFFDSIHFGRVAGFFHKNRKFNLPKDVSITLAQLACYNGSLPQGAPSSPIITNLIGQILDMTLLNLAKKYRLDYTRYADDLTFSTNDKKFLDNTQEFTQKVENALSHLGFSLNKSKTRIIYKSSRQTVTGLVVNKKINVSRDFYTKTRAMASSLYRTGEFKIGDTPGTLNQLEGRLSFIYQIEQYNLNGKKNNFHNLSAKGKLYRNFLFYKYFVANNKMLILTEGKTDIIYIKAALKNLYREYPKLITKNKETGTFEFHISFFNRTKRWEYFFGMSRDGADALKNLYRNFIQSPKLNKYTLVDFFQKQGTTFSKAPIIFLFDNELVTQRPLHSFVSGDTLSSKQIEELKKNYHVLLDSPCNLHLVSVPLITNKAECEIEDLFSEETLNTKINGRTFDRHDSNPSKFYNKDIFSKYVMKNYSNIDFNNFRPLLNILASL